MFWCTQSCKPCPADDASACILPYILVSLIYSPILPAVDARGVGCAALQGTPFSSTHSSSTADLKRLQSLGEAAFSQTLSLLSDKQFTKYCKMCSHILDFRFPDRRKNWDLLQYFCFRNNYCKQIIIFGPKNVLRYSCTFDKSDLYWRQYLWIKLYDHFVQNLGLQISIKSLRWCMLKDAENQSVNLLSKIGKKSGWV